MVNLSFFLLISQAGPGACAMCRDPFADSDIRKRFLRKDYHVRCLTCFNCDRGVATRCTRPHAQQWRRSSAWSSRGSQSVLSAPRGVLGCVAHSRCNACKEPITSDHVCSFGRHYHQRCLRCTSCGAVLCLRVAVLYHDVCVCVIDVQVVCVSVLFGGL